MRLLHGWETHPDGVTTDSLRVRGVLSGYGFHHRSLSGQCVCGCPLDQAEKITGIWEIVLGEAKLSTSKLWPWSKGEPYWWKYKITGISFELSAWQKKKDGGFGLI